MLVKIFFLGMVLSMLQVARGQVPANPTPAPTDIAIRTARDLDSIRNNLEGRYYLQNDIDLQGAEFESIGPGTWPNHFRGRLDGNGFTIRNFRTAQGLFRSMTSGAVVKNLRLENVTLTSGGAGAVVGTTWDEGFGNPHALIKNVEVRNLTHEGQSSLGGIVGSAEGWAEIQDSLIAGTLTVSSGANYVGGVVGRAWEANIRNTRVVLDNALLCGGTCGGMAGWMDEGMISDSVVSLSIQASGSRVGGLIGSTYSSTPIGPVRIDRTRVLPGLVETTSGTVGGLVGDAVFTVEIRDSSSQVEVRGEVSVGGMAGSMDGLVERSFAIGDVFGTEDLVGGLFGSTFDAIIRESYSLSSVHGENLVGGLVGFMRGTTVTDSFHRGEIFGHDEVGGVTGRTYGIFHNTFRNVYVASTVNATGPMVGPIVGDPTLLNTESVFYDEDLMGLPVGDYVGTPLSTAEMQSGDSQTFPGFSLDQWSFQIRSYPSLRNLPRVRN